MPTCPRLPCIEKISQFGRNKAITRHIEAGKSSKIVVKGSVCYYSDKALEKPMTNRWQTNTFFVIFMVADNHEEEMRTGNRRDFSFCGTACSRKDMGTTEAQLWYEVTIPRKHRKTATSGGHFYFGAKSNRMKMSSKWQKGSRGASNATIAGLSWIV